MTMKPVALASLLALSFLSLTNSAAARDELALRVGGMINVSPTYEGGKDYKVIGVPFIAPAGNDERSGRVQFRGIDHLQWALVSTGGFQFGPLAGYRFGREEDDGSRLRGLGDIDGGLVVGGFASYAYGNVRASASYHHQVTGDDTGAVVKLGLDVRQPVAAAVRLTAGAGLTWADDDYMAAFFGVSSSQALASGHSVYSAGAGIKDINASLGAEFDLSDAWLLKLSSRYARLVGDAGDSPVVETRDQWSAGIGVSYRFAVRR